MISRVRRTSGQDTKVDIPLPHYTIPIEKFADKRVKRHSIHGMMEEESGQRPHQEMEQLSLDEKKFLLAVERGDVASSRRMLQRAQDTDYIDINCMDPLGRSALLMAIDNENLEMVELLINHNVDTKDALLHAISEEFVEAVEVLLDHEDSKLNTGGKHSWESLSPDTATFTPDITPLILAAHRDNYEIIKILLDRGSVLPMPHDVRCGCDDCVTSRGEDSLRHSRSRINAYRALASPSLIALSSKDPILTAFELSWELRRLSFLEHEFKNEYQELRKQCQDFATALLDHTRTSHELEVLLNHDPTGPVFEHGERMHLNRLKLAIKLRQKKFVAHPNVQQLLASIWYEGLPGFRRKNMALQALEIIRIGMLFPLFSIAYIIAPHSTCGQTMRKPFIKFICNSASYLTFLFLLMLASQRIESVVGGWFWEAETVQQDEVPTKRGSTPTFVEWLILSWVSGLIWSEVKQLWDVGLQEYVNDMWNVIDFITNSLYVATVALRIVSYFQVQKEMTFNKYAADLPREKWDTWDPMLISEGLFSAANIFSSLKLVYIFSVNPHLGPLQVSLSRMVMDIMKFFFLYVLVLFAFSSGLNQLLWYYADLEKKRCVDNIQSTNLVINGTADPNACIVWRRFANLFETTQTLFWAVFGLVDLDSFELDGIKIFTRFWGMLMFGTYSVINIVVLLNLLIAMMNHSYQLISERADTEWKFARSRLWISYFEEGGTCPPPFNVIPTPKSFWYIIQWIKRKFCGHSRSMKKEHMRTIRQKAKQANQRDFIYQTIMRNLVRRYVTVEQRKAESQGVTEDDVNEIKQDISAFRCELVEILKNSGMNTSTASGQGSGAGGKKNRQKERRLMKGFNIAPPQQSTMLPPVAEFISALPHQHSDPPNYEMFGSPLSNIFGPGITPKKTHHNPLQQFSSSQSSFGDSQPSSSSKLGKLAPKFHTKRAGGSHKRRWGTLIEAAKSGSVSRFIGRSRSEDSVCNAPPGTSNRMDSGSHSNSPASDEAVTESATDSNPSLDRPDVETPRDSAKEPTHSFHFSALAALKRRRKKFSNSRNASPILEPPIEHDGVSKSSSKKLLKRASSVPTRTTINESMESLPPNGQDAPVCGDGVSATLTASTTDESVAGHLVIPICPTEPLLAGPMSGAMKMDANGHQQGQNLPNIIPLRGHLHQQGWL
ncbi:transient receptor potential-gamma protein isoform X1 [Lutzomyia longipalpis]|nr:transient receptor potential-gamma protein isoform X1 [Lutzomyia longipalpis]XP_055683397.1 transient receptor potential-gamma protein isoform X1 [Lutzomyia longipalpis]XP_055683398.1 transient receptor potential-gamma protein isoform X1 [Lutzomyia longipalpis]XP_055683399.1 transient receptor potential-gamma protein isoform X1 [Lutzomyia longipalpis]XP_055683400.1 transient receptor potential-gamma protein isoform X1 [Lutzomyia longipalpis]XP_055683401.1 transient receptor potential-gamma 